MDHIRQLADLATANLEKFYPECIEEGEVKVLCGDGSEGYPEEAPYDVIYIGASGTKVKASIMAQLRVDGKVLMPLDKVDQPAVVAVITKRDTIGTFDAQMKHFTGVHFDKLTTVEA